MANIEPVVPNLPVSTRAFTNKYGPGSQYATPGSLLQSLNGLPLPPHLNLRAATAANTITPLALYDAARANRGLSPLGPRQSAAALKTLTTGQPATPPRRQGLLQSAVSDLRALVGSIPKLPMLAVNEIRQLPEVPELAAEALSRGDNPLESLGNLAAVPGFRMVPGSFVANQLLGDSESGSQGVRGLMAHPLFTALDVLPVAQGAAARTGVVKAATAARQAENAARVALAEEITGLPGTARLAKPPRPIQTFLTQRLDESGALTPRALGRATGGLLDAFYSTPAGRGFQATFKERATSRMSSRADSFLRQFQDLDVPTSLLPKTYNGHDITDLLAIRDIDIGIRDLSREAGIDATRTSQLYDLASNPRLPDGTPVKVEQLPGLSDMERSVMERIRERQNAMARLTEGEFTKTINVNGTPEVYDAGSAKLLSRAESQLAKAREFRDARAMVLDPTDVTPERVTSLLDDVERRRAEGTITRAMADDLTRTYTAALDEAGWQMTEAGFQRVARPTSDDLLAALRPLARRYPTIPRLIDHLQNGQWAVARRELDQFASTRAGNVMVDQLPFDIDGLKAELSRLQARDRALARTSQYTDRLVTRLEAQQQRLFQVTPPARFVPAVQEAAAAKITERVGEIYAHDPDLPAMVEMAQSRVYDAIHELPAAEVRALQREARQSWQALRDAGHDPIFIARVTPEQAKRLPYARISDVPLTPAAARARMFDMTPLYKDLNVALSKPAMDLLQRRVTIGFLDEFEQTYARPRSEIVAELMPRAIARHAASPNIPVESHLNTLINEKWAPFDRQKFSPNKTSGAFSISSRDQPLVPRVMAENMDRLLAPPLPKLTAAFDPVMKIFRTSVLPLAPRWHLYNLVGGAALVASQDLAAFRYLPDVIRDMWRERRTAGGLGAGRVAHHLQPEGAPPSGFGTISADHRAFDSEINRVSPYKDRLAATHNYAAGQTLRRWWDQAREGRLGKITNGAKRGLEASYNANQLVDDMYRSIIGISSQRRALAKGATREMADAAAVQSIRRVFQAWDEMTPMERSIMRAVMPFYGWSSHILKYAFSYPFDHPIRVAILGSFARAEMTDALTGLPDYIRDMVLIGDKRANGVVKALNVGPFNPFRDLPSNFTVAGFLGNLNPVITGVLESVGVNVQQGGPSLYPETRYDPETGRLVADPGGNLVSNILGNISPQTNLFTSLIGRNESFNELLRRDPDAAGRQLMSNLGIPVLFRDINVGEELIRAEMARFEDQDNARREALSTGNLGILDAFPGLAAYGAQVKALDEAGALDELRPEEGSPGGPSGAGKAYALQVAALGT